MQENNNIDHRQRLVIRMSRNSLSFATVSEDNGQFTFEPYSLNSGISMAANLRVGRLSAHNLSCNRPILMCW